MSQPDTSNDQLEYEAERLLREREASRAAVVPSSIMVLGARALYEDLGMVKDALARNSR